MIFGEFFEKDIGLNKLQSDPFIALVHIDHDGGPSFHCSICFSHQPPSFTLTPGFNYNVKNHKKTKKEDLHFTLLYFLLRIYGLG